MAVEPSGRLELTWTNKHLRLLADQEGGYQWVPPSDYRVAEVRLLHDVEEVGETRSERSRAQDNLLVTGDALNALTSLCELPELAREYVGNVKLVYLDPPFNTQQAFEHYDDALEHSVWLTMMRDRLLQIRKLLSPDGSVWVHCDDSEQAYLKVMMDEVFGRDNFISVVLWQKVYAPRNDAKTISVDHDYIIIYAKQRGHLQLNKLPRTSGQDSLFSNPDDDPRGPWQSDNMTVNKTARERPNLAYDIQNPETGIVYPFNPNRVWAYERERMETLIAEGRVLYPSVRSGRPRIKRYLWEIAQGRVPQTWWTYEEVGHNQDAKREIARLQLAATPFDTPKPERLMQRIVHIASSPGDVVLDCFAGSGTTAAVAHKLGRRWIAIEWSRDTVETFTQPRLEKVVAGDDPGGITKDVGWESGGGFRVLEVGPSMFAESGGRVWLADWAANGSLGEATAAQLGFSYEPDPPFAGTKGRARLAVVDGLVNPDVARLLVGALAPEERLVLCGTAVDPEVTPALKELRPGSRARKIPASILAEYRIAREWR